ncbi:MAG: DUF58 domain-containing protein [Planctomycetes bacterium]|nr:DUF58 domain-containing protein [Planctomycetota bacterium]
MAIPFEDLFDADFLESLKHLKLVATRVPAGGRFAEQKSRDLGHGIEFRDYRPYSAGDDLRAVDWNIYRRLGRVFLRLFEEVEDLPLYLLPDVSRSAWLEQPPRVRAGLRACLALAAVSLGQHDTVGVFPFAEDLSVWVRPQSGKGRVMTYARRLAELEPGGATDLARSLRRLGGMRMRQGLCVIVSDFFDPAGIDAVVAALKQVRHRLLLVQLVKPGDREPALSGDLRLRDCETGAVEDVSVTPQVLESYRRAYDRFETTLTDFARRRGAGLVRLDVDAPVVPQLATLFETGHYSV